MVCTNDRGDMSAAIKLEDGSAYAMGEGIVVAMQRDTDAPAGRKMQSVVLTRSDLEAMQSADGTLTVTLEDGEAHHMGDGLFIVVQRDLGRRDRPMQNVVVTANDTAAMLRAA
jgi:hypothetical protein